MDQGPLVRAEPVDAAPDSAKSRAWKLRGDDAREAQGLVVSAFSHQQEAAALFLHLDRAGGGWLAALRKPSPTTNAGRRKNAASATIAFTWSGLVKMGLGQEALGSFSAPFREGMHELNRARRLGDAGADGRPDRGRTVVEDGPLWSGNTGRGIEGAPKTVQTPDTVHALLILYAPDEGKLAARVDRAERALRKARVRVVRRLPLPMWLARRGGRDRPESPREHFGFADGISQPVPYSKGVSEDDAAVVWRKTGRPVKAGDDPWHAVPLGDFLMGHPNAHGEPAPGPVVAARTDRHNALKREGAASAEREGVRDLGRNGTYLVVRELHQNVPAFWQSMEDAAKKLDVEGLTAERLAERVIGRTRDGHLLTRDRAEFPEPGGAGNDFGFFAGDRYGLGCPIGSHIRRANPRDGFGQDPASARTQLDAANNHRILRRGRSFGPVWTGKQPEQDKQPRGLLFMCLNTDIARQFEFIQQTWLLNGTFASLHREKDPLLGPEGPFTMAADPVRLRCDVATFVQMAGGEYFFLPSIPALQYLKSLTGKEQA